MISYVVVALVSAFIQLTFIARIYNNLRLSNIMPSMLVYFLIIFFYFIGELLLLTTKSPEGSILVHKYQSIFWINSANAFWYVICKITDRKTPYLLKISCVNSIIFTTASISSANIVGGVLKQPWNYVLVAGPLFGATITLCFIAPILAALFLLLKDSFNKLNSQACRKKSNLIFGGTLITVIIVCISDILLPHVLGYVDFYRIGANSTSIHLFFLLLATKTHISSKVKIENAWHYIFHNLDEGIVLLEDHKISYCNNAAQKLLKKSYSNLIGESETIINIPSKKLDTETVHNKKTRILILNDESGHV